MNFESGEFLFYAYQKVDLIINLCKNKKTYDLKKFKKRRKNDYKTFKGF